MSDVAVKEIANLGKKNGKFPGGEKLEFGIEEDGVRIAVTTTNEKAMTEDIIKAVDEWQEKILKR